MIVDKKTAVGLCALCNKIKRINEKTGLCDDCTSQTENTMIWATNEACKVKESFVSFNDNLVIVIGVGSFSVTAELLKSILHEYHNPPEIISKNLTFTFGPASAILLVSSIFRVMDVLSNHDVQKNVHYGTGFLMFLEQEAKQRGYKQTLEALVQFRLIESPDAFEGIDTKRIIDFLEEEIEVLEGKELN